MLKHARYVSETKIDFKYPSAKDPVLFELKNLAKIDINPTLNELEKVTTLVGYVHGLFRHDGTNTPTSSDPVTIIKEAQVGKSFRCVEYSLLASALLWAYGVPARVVGLKTSDVETREYGAGHVVIEFWSRDNKKWIMCDVQHGVIPEYENVFLSAYELGEKIEQNLAIEYTLVDHSRFTEEFNKSEKYTNDWIREYLYFFDTPIQVTFEDVDRQKQQIAMLVPLDVESPRIFQNMFMMNAVYTHSVSDFYPAYPF